ncbi:MAG TPA: hypothetical protein VGM10_07805 [Actinocrinis sp.]
MLQLLQAAGVGSATDAYRVVSTVTKDGTYLVGLNFDGDCEFLRTGSTADPVVALWLAPMDDQQPACSAGSAMAEMGLYGTSAAQVS